MNYDKLANALLQDIRDQFPEETKEHEQLIRDSIAKILHSLPKGWSRRKYIEHVRNGLNAVSYGKA